jgi:hypothetical protein
MSSNKIPRGLLCQRFRRHIDIHWSRCRAFGLYRLYRGVVPVTFCENTGNGGLFSDRGHRRGEYQTLHGAAVFQGRVQDRCSSSHSRNDEI